jgi:ABC-type spermidine/putrescine transport system permease subunit I
MNSKVDWMVVAGFLLTVLGVVLRTVLMMRSSDAKPANVMTTGREMLRSYSTVFPRSRLPVVMWTSLSIGMVLLIAGVLLELR